MLIPFESAAIFRFSARDARRYLNSRLTNNIRDLEPGSSCWAAALNHQGKVEALFTVGCIDSDTFVLVSTGGEAEKLLGIARQFIVADRVDTQNLSESHVLLHQSDPSAPFAEPYARFPADRFGSPGMDYIVPRSELAERTDGVRIVEPVRIPALRFRGRRLSVPEDSPDPILLTELPLEHAVSFSKGCYAGQEVIEKSLALGKVPRKVLPIVFAGIEPIAVGADVVVEPIGLEARVAGTIIASCPDLETGETLCYARLKNDVALLAGPFTCGGRHGTPYGTGASYAR